MCWHETALNVAWRAALPVTFERVFSQSVECVRVCVCVYSRWHVLCFVLQCKWLAAVDFDKCLAFEDADRPCEKLAWAHAEWGMRAERPLILGLLWACCELLGDFLMWYPVAPI
jgi:hypothetical protein